MKTRIASPMSYAAGYSLDLYCDHDNPAHTFGEFPHQFVAETFSQVAREARSHGWVFHANRTATCPKCSGKKPK